MKQLGEKKEGKKIRKSCLRLLRRACETVVEGGDVSLKTSHITAPGAQDLN